MASVRISGTDSEWNQLVENRRIHLGRFLSWAQEREGLESMRLSNRRDIHRVKEILPLFSQAWWATVVYTCFDSEIGTVAVAEAFERPIDGQRAEHVLSKMTLPTGAVKGHRTQPGHKGAKTALVQACARAEDFKRVLRNGRGFDGRYLALRALRAKQWARTTCFDLLVRTGQLAIESPRKYEPEQTYLAGSSGPGKGFRVVWGIEVTPSNANACEDVLRVWTENWDNVARFVGVSWNGDPYGPGDFENALCIYQEPGNPGYQGN